MKIINYITYTYKAGEDLREEQAQLVRPYTLTHRGALRILKQSIEGIVSVNRVESFILK